MARAFRALCGPFPPRTRTTITSSPPIARAVRFTTRSPPPRAPPTWRRLPSPWVGHSKPREALARMLDPDAVIIIQVPHPDLAKPVRRFLRLLLASDMTLIDGDDLDDRKHVTRTESPWSYSRSPPSRSPQPTRTKRPSRLPCVSAARSSVSRRPWAGCLKP